MNIIKNQYICGKIVIPESPLPTENYASTELRYYFNRMTANPADIVKTNEAVEDALIVIGGALTNYGEERLTYADDELHWYTKNGKVFIDGGKRGLLYAMYDFLEALGCRFFTPKAEKIPAYTEFVLDETDKREKPILEYRAYYFRDTSLNPAFEVKARTNENTRDPKYGGEFNIATNCHSFYFMLPIKKYFDEHPDWYALYDGKRGIDEKRGGWQLCLSNPEVTEKLIEVSREILRNNPEARVINLQQNDFGRSCECEKCRAIDEEEGSPSGLMIRVVNAVAEALEEEFPNVVFQTFAYSYTQAPPKYARPRHNVAVQFCTIGECAAHPITSGCGWGENDNLTEQLKEWSSICNHVSVWDYVTCFWHLPQPHPNWHVLQPNIQFFVENNAKWLFSQNDRHLGDGADLDELRCYLVCKLMWDPYCDLNKHIVEFTDFFYGAAGPMVREYMETMCKICEDNNYHFTCYGHGKSPNRIEHCAPFIDYLTPEYLKIYHEILDRAEEAVRDDVIRRMRIDKIRLTLRFIELRTKGIYDDINDEAEINQFIEDCVAHNVTEFAEAKKLPEIAKLFAEKRWR